MCLAIASAARGIAVRESLAAFGEVGLTGRLRPATQAERRLEECAKLGLDTVLAPIGTTSRPGTDVVEVETIGGALPAGLGSDTEGSD